MTPRILLSVPHMGGAEQSCRAEAFPTNWLSTVGPNIDAFENEFAAHIGMSSVALSSGTAAMHLGLRLLGVGPDDEVFCPTLTFVVTANPIAYFGAKPVFLDSDRATWNLDPELLSRALANRANRNQRPKAVNILEDAAEALGSTYKGRPLGTHSGSPHLHSIATRSSPPPAAACFGRKIPGSFKPRASWPRGRATVLGYENSRIGCDTE